MYLLGARREEIRDALTAAHMAAVASGALPDAPVSALRIEAPRDRAHGDFACNLPLVLSQACHLPPRTVAAALCTHLPRERISDLAHVEVAGPGFLNFHMRPGWLAGSIAEILAAGGSYGTSVVGGAKRVLVEYVSANPTGPLNVVNCRAAAFGDALVRCLRAVGYRADAEYYVNDAGGQFRKLAQSLEARLRQVRGEGCEVPEGGYPGQYLMDLARSYVDRQGWAVLDLAPAERERLLGRYAVNSILADQKSVLKRFGVTYDHFTFESDIRASGRPELVIAQLEAAGKTKVADGALWLLTAGAGDNDDRVLRKRDGELTYRVPDIAYHAEKFERGYDLLVDIYGPDHHGEVPAVRLALEWLGMPTDRLEVLITQVIRLVRDGQEVKISKRGGTFHSMDEFLDDVGVDAARFFFLMRTTDSHMDFDIDLARRQSQDNPVYYVQYAHARICSILRQANRDMGAAPPRELLRKHLTHEAEVELCRSLAAFPDEVLAAAESRSPQRLTTFARQTAERFHAFYVQCRVLGEDPELSVSRLALCTAAGTVMRLTLGLLGVGAPERM